MLKPVEMCATTGPEPHRQSPDQNRTGRALLDMSCWFLGRGAVGSWVLVLLVPESWCCWFMVLLDPDCWFSWFSCSLMNLSVLSMWRLLVAGCVFFPGLFLICKHLLRRAPFHNWGEGDAVIISARYRPVCVRVCVSVFF